MKVAKARYTGRMSSKHLRVPDGDEYRFRRYSSPENDGREWLAIESTSDAEWLEGQAQVEVEWSPMGRLQGKAEDAVEAVKELGYEQKQKLVGEFGLDIAKNSSDDELEEALREHVDTLHEEGGL